MYENEISEKIIGAAIEVHRILGPGLLESVYEDALCHELHLRGIKFTRQQNVPISYKGIKLSIRSKIISHFSCLNHSL